MANKPNSMSTEDILDNSDIDLRKLQVSEDLNNPMIRSDLVYQIWWNWADFHLYIVNPTIEILSPSIIIPPETISDTDQLEFVYPIHDTGSQLSTSKSEDMIGVGKSMYKLYMTIEKMIYLLIERLKSKKIDTSTEVRIAFGGHLLAQRKAFESVINLAYNVIVTNFDPGSWGKRYLQTIKQNAETYGYPSASPREIYKKLYERREVREQPHS